MTHIEIYKYSRTRNNITINFNTRILCQEAEIMNLKFNHHSGQACIISKDRLTIRFLEVNRICWHKVISWSILRGTGEALTITKAYLIRDTEKTIDLFRPVSNRYSRPFPQWPPATTTEVTTTSQCPSCTSLHTTPPNTVKS